MIEVQPAASVTTVTGLSPWRWYSLHLAAYNDVGVGPDSDIVRARTLAEGIYNAFLNLLDYFVNLVSFTH